MTQTPEYPKIHTVGLDGILVTFGAGLSDAANRAALAFRAAIDALAWPEVQESASTLVSAYFRIDLVEHAPDPLIDRLKAQIVAQDWFAADLPAGRRLWTIPVRLGGDRGPQMAEFAELAGLSEAEVRSDLLAARLRVLTLGFAPGTPYLGGMPARWNVPRQTELSKQVPKGALVTAVQQVILFSKTSPTGWRHIGQTAFRGFAPEAAEPILLRPGDEVTFTEISASELEQIEARNGPRGGAQVERLG